MKKLVVKVSLTPDETVESLKRELVKAGYAIDLVLIETISGIGYGYQELRVIDK